MRTVKLGIMVLVISLCSWPPSAGQVTIWSEDFNSYPDSTRSGSNNNQANPNSDWVAGECLACVDTADWWEIRSGTMEARDVNEVVFFQTEVIDISGFTDLQFSLDIVESGDHEGPYFGLDACADQTNEDYVNVLYRIDGGSWNLVKNYLTWCGLYDSCNSHTLYGDDGINSGDCRDNDSDWESATVVQSILLGNSLEIRLEIINSSDTELIRFDNLMVEGHILLPVALKSFSATAHGNVVWLDWQTASETNNDYFQVERSPSGAAFDWIPVARVAGAGYSSDLRKYRYSDQSPITGRSYYRLKQVDFDGAFSYSNIQSVMTSPATDPYPNPAKDHLIIPFDVSLHKPPDIELFDITARKISVLAKYTQSHIRLDISSLTSGNYIIYVNTNGFCNKHRILVVR